jgi:hypothetical protein
VTVQAEFLNARDLARFEKFTGLPVGDLALPTGDLRYDAPLVSRSSAPGPNAATSQSYTRGSVVEFLARGGVTKSAEELRATDVVVFEKAMGRPLGELKLPTSKAYDAQLVRRSAPAPDPIRYLVDLLQTPGPAARVVSPDPAETSIRKTDENELFHCDEVAEFIRHKMKKKIRYKDLAEYHLRAFEKYKGKAPYSFEYPDRLHADAQLIRLSESDRLAKESAVQRAARILPATQPVASSSASAPRRDRDRASSSRSHRR